MKEPMASLQDKTLRFHFSNGVMKDKDFDHTFHKDGTVEWGPAGGKKSRNRNAAITRISDSVYVASYMSDQGYTLTSTFDLDTGKLVSFASDGKEWSKQEGTVTVQ
jgi:hypothetical protein